MGKPDCGMSQIELRLVLPDFECPAPTSLSSMCNLSSEDVVIHLIRNILAVLLFAWYLPSYSFRTDLALRVSNPTICVVLTCLAH
jgi:hypothetical protein